MQAVPPNTSAPGFWTSLSDGDRAALSERGHESVFARGTPLCREGDPSTHVLVLLSGWAKVFSSTEEGHEMVLALRGPGDVIGELATDLGGYRTATVLALCGSRRFSLALTGSTRSSKTIRARYACTARSWPSASMKWARTCARGWRAAGPSASLACCSTSRSLWPCHRHGVLLAVPLSQADLASWVGVSRATVTRALRSGGSANWSARGRAA